MENIRKRMSDLQRVDGEELSIWKDNHYTGMFFKKYKGVPFTGFEIVEYHKNGKPAFLQQYVNGEDIGWRISFYDNGMVEDESFELGATGVYIFSYDRDGNLLSSGSVAPESILIKLCEIIGEDPENIKPLEFN